jgi:transcriptional regulator with GAF, ATPase, and Fis domain
VIQAGAGGTVLLDEIGDLTLEAQGALLRFLQSGEIQPVGATRPVNVDVRVIAATNCDLSTEVEARRFRKDLYHRLNVATLFVPPLRERREDVRELAYHFAHVYGKQYGKAEAEITREEMRCLVEYDWPGNVRELENYVKRRVLFGEEEIDYLEARASSGLPKTNQRFGSEYEVPWRRFSESGKRERLIAALEKTGGNVTLAAKNLGISRRTVQRYKTNIRTR